jgi:hypothetical protein
VSAGIETEHAQGLGRWCKGRVLRTVDTAGVDGRLLHRLRHRAETVGLIFFRGDDDHGCRGRRPCLRNQRSGNNNGGAMNPSIDIVGSLAWIASCTVATQFDPNRVAIGFSPNPNRLSFRIQNCNFKPRG